jgi:hypothetical protein
LGTWIKKRLASAGAAYREWKVVAWRIERPPISGEGRRVNWTPTRPEPFPSAESSQRGHGSRVRPFPRLLTGGSPIPRCLALPLVSVVPDSWSAVSAVAKRREHRVVWCVARGWLDHCCWLVRAQLDGHTLASWPWSAKGKGKAVKIPPCKSSMFIYRPKRQKWD